MRRLSAAALVALGFPDVRRMAMARDGFGRRCFKGELVYAGKRYTYRTEPGPAGRRVIAELFREGGVELGASVTDGWTRSETGRRGHEAALRDAFTHLWWRHEPENVYEGQQPF